MKKLRVLLTHDDREKPVQAFPVKFHRRFIGLEADAEASIDTHIYPNPGKWHDLVIYFPTQGKSCANIVAVAQFEDKEMLVAPNKKALTKLGKELVYDANFEDFIKRLYNGKDIKNSVVKHLEPQHYAELYFDYDNGSLQFLHGTIKIIYQNKGLVLNPKVEIQE